LGRIPPTLTLRQLQAGSLRPEKERIVMAVILVFVALIIVGQSISVMVAFAVEQFSTAASVLVFFAMFALMFVVAWYTAVYIAERYLRRFLTYGEDPKAGRRP
jgi:ABC-type amino acid transport system permease subunit